MRALILVAIFCLSSYSAFASSNPQIRTCRLHQADFWSLNITKPKKDQIGFCKYGNALIDSISFMKYVHQNEITGSLSAYFNSKAQSFHSCKSAGAKQIFSFSSNGTKEVLCVFRDYSFIKKSTLVKGWHAPDNFSLTQAISNI